MSNYKNMISKIYKAEDAMATAVLALNAAANYCAKIRTEPPSMSAQTSHKLEMINERICKARGTLIDLRYFIQHGQG